MLYGRGLDGGAALNGGGESYGCGALYVGAFEGGREGLGAEYPGDALYACGGGYAGGVYPGGGGTSAYDGASLRSG